jgi:AcrR family transcriptional regulator
MIREDFMPRFSENERDKIHNKLLAEGERLFARYGLKKATIDDLAESVGIAKASFYKFYENKEYLYLDIVQGIQLKIFNELDLLLESNTDLPGRERVRQVFEHMFKLMLQYPVLTQIDVNTTLIIDRKVSKDRLMAFKKQNIDAAQKLHDHGIKFTCDIETASLVFQSLYHCWMQMHEMNTHTQTSAIDILLNGVINQIIE